MGILLDKLTEYAKSDFYPYHMPGHKRQQVGSFPEQITEIDITEIDGFDNLHQAEGLLKEAQERAALAYGARESFFLVNGSTCGILSAISAAVPFGGHLLVARNCHKSIYHGAYLRHLKLSYIYPEILEEFDICEAITAKQVEEALQNDDSIQAVLIVSPTYEGRIADVAAIAEVVHAKGLPLIVDEAHGAHLGFYEGFAVNSSRLGADLVINSVHKTLPAMTQTALLHCNGSLVDRDKLKRFLHIYQSSSPSYVMMASIDHAVETVMNNPGMFADFQNNWKKMLEKLQVLKKLQVLPHATAAAGPGQKHSKTPTCAHDIGKLIISIKGTSLSGQQLADILREKYHLQMEMACETYVLAMFTVCDKSEGYERLAAALLALDRQLQEAEDSLPQEGSRKVLPKEAEQNRAVENIVTLPFFRAWDCMKEEICLKDAEGCMAGEFINLYPPGTPIAVPGEVLSRELILLIQRYLNSGLEVQGIRKKENDYIVNIIRDGI